MVKTDTAMAIVNSVPPSELIYICKAKGSVNMDLDFNTRTGHTYSFQELIKKMMLVEIIAGLMRGTTTSRRVLKLDEFSMPATSKMDFGMVLIDCRMRKMPVASAS